MTARYQITIVKIPQVDDSINRNQNSFTQYQEPVHFHNDENALSTILTEAEFLKVRSEILKHWESNE